MTQNTPHDIPKGATLIEVNKISKLFHLRGEDVYAVRDVSFDIKRGEYLSIMGPSGSGKTTLFNMIGALDVPTSGSVSIGPLDLTKLTSRQLAYVRNHYIGYIFQAYNLIWSLTALRNVSLAAVFGGADEHTATQQAKQVLELVGLGHRLDHRPDELSGGQQQRVAIARALVNDPAIILADEPTANLDFKTGADIIGLLKKLSQERGVTIVTATHDHKMLVNSDRILWMRDGQVDRIDRREDLDIQVGQIEVHGEEGAATSLNDH
ncbi:MAG: ABC transporter ATP-binding protein [Phycisphaeraceae bacterium]|nr:ABC transporter ATP-binding protein [Phycisphaeraceae bacterium]